VSTNSNPATEALKKRFESDDTLIWHDTTNLQGKSRYLAISQKWVVLFKSINHLEQPLLWLPRDMIAKVHFSTYRDTMAGSLFLTATTGQVMDFGEYSEFKSHGLLRVLDAEAAENLAQKIEARGKNVGKLRGKGFFGEEITIYENRIYSNTRVMDLDENTVAEVILEGQKVVSARPTLTRMAALAFLPGTALIPGLAFQKKTTKDERQLIIVIANANANISFELEVNQLAQAKAIATQINSIAEQKHRALQQQTTPAIQPVPIINDSLVSQLKALKELLDSGAITQEEFVTLKNKMIGS
jgi:Short C-terminal domain